MAEPVRGPIRVPRWPSTAAEASPTSPPSAPSSTSPRSSRPTCWPRPSAGPREPPLPELDATDVPLVTLDPVGQPGPRPGRAPRRPRRRLPGQLRDRRRRRVRPARQRARRRGAPPRPDALQPRPAHPAAPAGAQRGRREPAARRAPPGRRSGRSTSTPTASRSQVELRRARVRSRAQLDYPRCRPRPTPARCPSRWPCCPRSARCCEQRAAERGAIELGTPEQEVVADAGRRLDPRPARRPARRGWNAQISLLTGRCAAALMLDGGVGCCARCRPPAARTSTGSGSSRPRWASTGRTDAGARRGRSPASTRATPGTRPSSRRRPPCCAARPTRPSTARRPSSPCTAASRPRTPTSPRRCGGWSTGSAPRSASPWPPAPSPRPSCARRSRSCRRLMAASDRRTREVERAVVDAIEAWLLRGREGQAFSAVVVDAEDGKRHRRARRPRRPRPVRRARALTPGTRVRVRLEEADVAARTDALHPGRAA